jgi:arginase
MKDKFILTPFYLDQPLPGLEGLTGDDWAVNLPTTGEGNIQEHMGVLYQPLAEFVFNAVSEGGRPVSIAGDCCTSIGVFAGLKRANIYPDLIWFDAHGDFNTWETTPSGFLGGMPLAMLVGRGEQTILEAVGLNPIDETKVILTDARDLDPGERESLEESQVVHMTNVEELLNYPLGARDLYIHFDTDIVDPSEAPGMNYPAPGGPSVYTLQRVFQHLAHTDRIVAVSLSSWNPSLDPDGRSQTAAMSLLHALLEG